MRGHSSTGATVAPAVPSFAPTSSHFALLQGGIPSVAATAQAHPSCFTIMCLLHYCVHVFLLNNVSCCTVRAV
jgi:hypothetical protein